MKQNMKEILSFSQIQECYREFMWMDEKNGYIAFDVKNIQHEHQYYEYIKFFYPENVYESQS